MAIHTVTITQQILWWLVPWEGLNALLSNPLGRRVFNDGIMNQLASPMAEDHQTKEQLKSDRRYNKQVHSSDAVNVIA